MASDFRACCLCLPGLPPRASCTVWSLCKSDTETVWQPQWVCGSHIRPVAVLYVQEHTWGCSTAIRVAALVQQHQCGCAISQDLAGKQRIGHEWGPEASVQAETLSRESCAPQDASRMSRLPKKQENHMKTFVFGNFWTPGSCCAARWREAPFTLVPRSAGSNFGCVCV